jgi:hypothetical protein
MDPDPQIFKSVPLLTDPDSDPDHAIFVRDLQDGNKNYFFLLLFKATYTPFFKDIKSVRNHKTVRIKDFLTILA